MKKFKYVIMNSSSLILSILMLVFLGCAYSVVSVAGVQMATSSGYDMIEFKGADFKQALLSISNIMVIICLSLLIIALIYTILRNTNVIKTEKFDKLTKIASLVLAITLVVFMALAMLMGVLIMAEMNDLLAGAGKVSPGWAIGVNFAFSVIILVVTILASKFFKKSK